MDTCKDCLLLNEGPSSMSPHPSLVSMGTVHSGSGSGWHKIGTVWRCVACGSTMHQSTEQDKECPGLWNFGMNG